MNVPKFSPRVTALLGIFTVLALCVVALDSAKQGTLNEWSAQVSGDCVGMPYGTAGCPVISQESSTQPTSLPRCGNAIIDPGEQCDRGRFNGISECRDCRLLYCGDGVVSASIAEECEPTQVQVYGVDPQTGALRIVTQFEQPSCGKVCTVPSCDLNGNCNANACRWQFLPACTGTPEPPTIVTAPNVSSTQTFETPTFSQECGDGILQAGEQCDDNNTFAGDGCSPSCAAERGYFCFGTPSVCTAKCGDGLTVAPETCDDANLNPGDGCSATCRTETGYSCQGNPSQCASRCGDGIMAGSEACDDGNTFSGDGCSDACFVERGYSCSGRPNSVCQTRCGDGIKAGNEACDDGNLLSEDGCSATCAVERGYACTGTPSMCGASCGDGVVAGDEQCDDDNLGNGDGCSSTCLVERGYACDGSPSVCAARCGDGVINGQEECDDGNTVNEDACTSRCTTPRCGDGIIQTDEQCDDGNKSNIDACTNTCRGPVCGDGILQQEEQCDSGRKNSDETANACRMNCQPARCGDSVIDEGEQCDGGEECASDCTVLKSAAGVLATEGWFENAWVAGLVGVIIVLVAVIRKLYLLYFKPAGSPQSLDEIPLSEIEQSVWWHSTRKK